MLQIHVPATELWVESKQEFVYLKEQTLELEHSLVSLSKWESKWCKSFLFTKEITSEEALDYIRCMTLTPNVSPEVYECLTSAIVDKINSYINSSMTATTVNEIKSTKKSREIVTAEVIYYWMIALNIPSEYENWHLNRLITLIKVVSAKNAPSKKQSKQDLLNSYAALNEANKKRFNSKG